jgi:hypothetical protein
VAKVAPLTKNSAMVPRVARDTAAGKDAEAVGECGSGMGGCGRRRSGAPAKAVIVPHRRGAGMTAPH